MSLGGAASPPRRVWRAQRTLTVTRALALALTLTRNPNPKPSPNPNPKPKPDQVRVEQSEAELHEQLAAKADRSTMATAENMVEDIANPSPKP